MPRNFNGSTDRVRLSAAGLTGMTHGTYAAIFRVVNTANFRTLFAFLNSGATFIHTPMQVNDVADQMTWNNSAIGSALPADVWLLGVMRKATGTQVPRFSYYRYDTGVWVHASAGAGSANHASIAGTDLVSPDTGDGSEAWQGDIALLAAWENHLPWAADAIGDAALEAAGLQWDLLAWLNSYGHQTPPSFASAGAGAITEASGGALSPASPATVDAGDLLIIFAYYEGVTTTPSTPSGFTLLDGPRTLASNVGRCWVFGKIADGTEDGAANALGTPAVTTMRAARCYRFINVRSDTIANVVGGFAFDGPASAATINDVGVTTPEAACLAVNLITVADDNALVAFTGETGGDWTEAIAEFTSAATTPDYAQGINTAPIAAAGTINGGSQTMAAADPWGVVGFYIRPSADGVAANPPSLLAVYDQSSTGQSVVDLTGNGGNQTAVNGTSVSTADPPGFGYGADPIVSPGHPSGAAGTNAPAGSALATGSAPAAEVTVAPLAGSSMSASSAPSAEATIAPEPGSASGAGTAPAPVASVVARAGSASATGTTPTPEASLGVLAGSTQASGTAPAPTVATGAVGLAGSAAGSGDAPGPEVTIAVSAGSATSVGSVSQAEATVGALAGSSLASGAAAGPEVTVGAPAGTAPAVGSAPGPTAVTGTAGQAGSASAQGAAAGPEVTIGALAGSSAGTGVALGPTILTGVTGQAGSATALGSSPQAEATIGVKPDGAAAVGTAPGPTVQIGNDVDAQAGSAIGVGSAPSAEVTIAPQADSAPGAGVAPSAIASVGARAGSASATGLAPEADVQIDKLVLAGSATASGTVPQVESAVAVFAGLAAAIGEAHDILFVPAIFSGKHLGGRSGTETRLLPGQTRSHLGSRASTASHLGGGS